MKHARKRILFVDDEPNVLRGLRRSLHGQRDRWDMEFLGSGEEALRSLSIRLADVLVSGLRLPGLSGHELMRRVRDDYPELVRILFSGHSDGDEILQSVNVAHRLLSKPCSTEDVIRVVDRACGLREHLHSGALKRLVTRCSTLPSLPSLYLRIQDEIRSPQGSMESIGNIIARDLGMATRILQVVNSALFGLRQTVTSPAQAASMLGLDLIRSLVLSMQVFSQVDLRACKEFSMTRLWDHSLTVAAYAKAIAAAEGCDHKTCNQAFLAGNLHDVGKLILAANLPEEYGRCLRACREEGLSLMEGEERTFGTSHAEVGAYLLGLWGFPGPVIEVVGFHHRPAVGHAEEFSVLTAVHAANAIEHGLSRSSVAAEATKLDLVYLERIGKADRLEVWRDACEQDVSSKDAA